MTADNIMDSFTRRTWLMALALYFAWVAAGTSLSLSDQMTYWDALFTFARDIILAGVAGILSLGLILMLTLIIINTMIWLRDILNNVLPKDKFRPRHHQWKKHGLLGMQ